MALTINELLRDIKLVKSLTANNWTQVISQAREQKVLGRLHYFIEESELLEALPEYVKPHLWAASQLYKQHAINIEQEVTIISNALRKKGITTTLLKGAAYSLNGNKCSFGRTYSDIDLLVEKKQIPQAEIAMMVEGWFHKKETDYDKMYYRKWMHEIEPMIHNKRFTVIDLHHNLMPPTNVHFVDIEHFDTVKLEMDNVAVLSDVAMLMHSNIHLFTESELQHPLRDITDISLLLEEILDKYSLSELVTITTKMGTSYYLKLGIYFAFPYCNYKTQQKLLHYFSTVIASSSLFERFIIFPAYGTIFSAPTIKPKSFLHKMAIFVIYVRGHYIRMPLNLLIPHLCRKFIFNTKTKIKEYKNANN